DLGIIVFVTAGLNPTYVPPAAVTGPTVCVHTFPLQFALWAEKCERGQHLVIPEVRQMPPRTLDPRIKTRSRMHWFLADRQARQVDPQASALALDGDGFITETSTGNFFIADAGGLRTPPPHKSLGGISQRVVRELAEELGLGYEEVDLRPKDVHRAAEAFTSSTPYCLLPVVRLDGRPIGDGRPGAVFRRLIDAWSGRVGVEILTQMRGSISIPVR
ncbi:MAG: aminotransferase class IV, partial [Planctomycetaceae bacterium]